MTLGATPFSIYPQFTPQQIAYVVGDAEAKVAIIEAAFLETFGAARAELPALETLIVLEGGAARGRRTGPTSRAPTRASTPTPHWQAVQPDDLLTLIYTSGTTGPPKGVQLSHRNVMAGARAADAIIRFPDGSRVISWLPAAHIAERMAHQYLPIVFGMTVTTAP